MDLNIAGRRALVTGAASGIGYATVRELLAEDATVIMADCDQEKMQAAFEGLDAGPDQLHAFTVDITSTESVQSLKTSVAERVGEIDILVQSAGIRGAAGLFHEIDEEGWLHTLDVDLMGQVRVQIGRAHV